AVLQVTVNANLLPLAHRHHLSLAHTENPKIHTMGTCTKSFDPYHCPGLPQSAPMPTWWLGKS
ncbi:hypothetical protein E4T56_gene17177, partial [Termitomyces sp. T112]